MNDSGDKRETPYGILYKPRSIVVQILVLFIFLISTPGIVTLLSIILGGLTTNAQAVLFFMLFLILMLGYGLWLSRLQVLAFNMIGKSILSAIFQIIIRRKKPEKFEDILPTPEKLEQMVVNAQKASSSFMTISTPIAFTGGLLSLLFESTSGTVFRILVVSGGCLLWGYVLSYFGRRGFLPLPEDGE